MKNYILAFVSALAFNSAVECGRRKDTVQDDIRAFGRTVSLHQQSSFSNSQPGIVNEESDYGPLQDENGNFIFRGNELSKIKHILVKNIVQSIAQNSDSTVTQDSNPEDQPHVRRKLSEYLHQLYDGRGGHQFVELASQEYRHDVFNLKSGYIKFSSIAPHLFQMIRQSRGITDLSYKNSLEQSMVSVGPLKSGAYFFYTSDNRYIVKFLRSTDGIVFTHMLPGYVDALRDKSTLLADTIGFYRFIHRNPSENIKNKYYAIVVRNIFPENYKMDIVYDLKGSTHNRNGGGVDGAAIAQKDCVYLLNDEQLQFGPYMSDFLSQLRKDTRFMAEGNVNDYSLLVGIRYVDASEVVQQQDLNGEWDGWYSFQGGFLARNNDGSVFIDEQTNKVKVVYVSVIDILTEYNQDRIEDHRRKAIDEDIATRMSNIPPMNYWQRFLHKMKVWNEPDSPERLADKKICLKQALKAKSFH
jgi:hypothetical protein